MRGEPSQGEWPLDQGDDADLLVHATYAFPPDPARHVGVAVSGGGDSVALLHLMLRACRHQGVPVSAVTVDHGLRDGSAVEAATVAALCAKLEVPHKTVQWDHGIIRGNLMDAARRARMALIATWARDVGVTNVALGHTADDQAETFLMALSRSSGLDGLMGMRRSWRRDGLSWSRPLLDSRRADLRAYLRRQGLSWAEDPTNADPRFERTRARAALAALEPLGIDADSIGATLYHLRMAQWALRDQLRRAAQAMAHEVAGGLLIGRAGFADLPHDLQRQMLVAAVGWLSGDPRPPRTDKQINLLCAARDGRAATLHGCRLRVKSDQLLLTREPRTVASLVAEPGHPWDHRWHLTGPCAEGQTIRALGAEGLRLCPDWRATRLPREALVVTPAVWRDETLIAAPVARPDPAWSAEVRPDFAAWIAH